MVRPLRIEFPGAVYHVTSRGNERAAIYRDANDRERFLACLAKATERYEWVCHAYCLMGNHYHLLLETPRPNLALGMRQLNGTYAQGFNRRHGRVGHLFQARYWAILVEMDTHLLELSRYIVLNPVRAGLCATAQEWPWSSYAATIGLEPPAKFLNTDWVLGQFGAHRPACRRRYHEFVHDHNAEDPWANLRGRIYLAREPFIAEHVGDREPIVDIPREQWQPLRPDLPDLLSDGRHALLEAHRRYGYTQREIADTLGLHYSTVSRAIAALETQEETANTAC